MTTLSLTTRSWQPRGWPSLPVTLLTAGMTMLLWIMTSPHLAQAQSTSAPAALHGRMTDLGSPVQRNAIYNHLLGQDAQGRPRYYQAYRGSPWFLLSIDPATGQSVQFKAQGDGNPWGMLQARNGKIYITTGGGGRDDVYVFDPAAQTLDFLGRPTQSEHVIWSLVEGADGHLYGGTYPEARLVRINTQTHELTDLGRISPDQMYIRNLAADGPYIYCNAGPSLPAVWAYDTRDGSKKQILPPALRSRKVSRYGTAEKRADGHVYVYANGINQGYRVRGLQIEPALIKPLPDQIAENHQGRPDRVILTLPDQSTLRVVNTSGAEKFYLHTPPGGQPRKVQVAYEGSPTPLWAVEEGPDGRVYGTTRTPVTLFAYDPTNQTTTILGDPIDAKGQVYSWLWHEGRLYMASYGGSRLVVWDPARPWRFGSRPQDNPRYLGQSGIGRPGAMALSPDGRQLLIAGLPTYGATGGVLTLLDLHSGQIEILQDVVGDQSIGAMASLPGTDLVCLATTWRGGSAAQAKETPPRILLYNLRKRSIEFETTALAAPAELTQMQPIDGKLYLATASDQGHLVVFNPATRQVEKVARLPHGPVPIFGLRHREADGMLYALSGDLTGKHVVRIDPQTLAMQTLGYWPGAHYGLALVKDQLYLCAGEKLIALNLADVQP